MCFSANSARRFRAVVRDLISSAARRKRQLSWAYVVALVVAVGFFLLSNLSAIQSSNLVPKPGWLFIALFIGVSIRWVMAVNWLVLLRSHSKRADLSPVAVVKLFADSWWGRYLPGRVGTSIARLAGVSRLGIYKLNVVTSTFAENVLPVPINFIGLSVGLALSLNVIQSTANIFLTSIFVAIVVFAMAHPRTLGFLVNAISRTGIWERAPVRIGTVPVNVASTIFQVLVVALNTGVIASLLLSADIGLEHNVLIVSLVLSTSASLANMLAIVVPSGIGAVEASITGLLVAFGLEPVIALLFALAWRLHSITSDFLFWVSVRVPG